MIKVSQSFLRERRVVIESLMASGDSPQVHGTSSLQTTESPPKTVTSGSFFSCRFPTHSHCGCSDSYSHIPTEELTTWEIEWMSPTDDVQYSDHEEKGITVVHILEQEYSSGEEMDHELEKNGMTECVPSPVRQLSDECQERNKNDDNENLLDSEDPFYTCR